MKHGWITVTVAALTLLPATPAVAVDSASCRSSGEAHAGRQFTLSSQTEPITGSYTYRWDLDHDGTFETDTGEESTVKVERATAGTYTFGVQVTDADFPPGDPKREARGTCDVTVVNDQPRPLFEAHPLGESFPTAYEALRFTYGGSDSENELNQRPMTHAIDFDGDGRFEYTVQGAGEVFASFPAGFDKDVTHRVTDDAGASVDTRLRIKTTPDAFGIGDGRVLAPLSTAPLGTVTAKAPKKIKRRTLLKRGVTATFSWGASWGRVRVQPAVKKVAAFTFEPDTAYAPGQRVAVKPLPPQLKQLVRKGAKKLELRWTAAGKTGIEKKGTLVVRITR